ncbi:MAG: nucleoside deaminase [Candidatus Levyibacteriota bacterium]
MNRERAIGKETAGISVAFAAEVAAMKKEARAYSAQEYLAFANEQALLASSEGNYGVGAVYVFRTQGKEFVIGGRNGIISGKDTHLHAEQSAIDAIESIARGETTFKDRVLMVRPAPHQDEERKIYTSLEPCPMCTARILTHKVDEVFIGSPDDFAGTMLDGRENGLPPLWKGMREGAFHNEGEEPKSMKVTIPQDNLESPDFVDPKYRNLASKIFLSTREVLDEKMGGRGLSPDLSPVPQVIERFDR